MTMPINIYILHIRASDQFFGPILWTQIFRTWIFWTQIFWTQNFWTQIYWTWIFGTWIFWDLWYRMPVFPSCQSSVNFRISWKLPGASPYQLKPDWNVKLLPPDMQNYQSQKIFPKPKFPEYSPSYSPSIPQVFPKHSPSIPQVFPKYSPKSWIFPRYSAVSLQVFLEYSP